MHYDLIIIGGGLVGASLALGLKDKGVKIALVDARMPSSQDGRLFALNHTSCQLLSHLGLWSTLQPHAASIQQVHVSHRGHFGAVRLRAEEMQLPQLGYVVPAYQIEAAFQAAFEQFPSEAVFRPAVLKSLTQDEVESGVVEVVIEQQGKECVLTTNLLLGADGAESTVRKQLGIATDDIDYGQLAIVTRTLLQREHQGIAYERFTETGAIAMLPLPAKECATIWTADKAMAETLLAMDDAAFLHALQKAFGYRLGKLQSVANRLSYPLRLVKARQMMNGRVGLLGNAAHAMHPIAAQGFNLALFEVATLIELIEDGQKKSDKWDDDILMKLNDAVQKHQSTSMGLSHRLVNLFSSESRIPSAALSLGMIGLDVATPLKSQFIHRVMGSVGRLPRLLLSD